MGSLTDLEFRILESYAELIGWFGIVSADWDKKLKIFNESNTLRHRKIRRDGTFWMFLCSMVLWTSINGFRIHYVLVSQPEIYNLLKLAYIFIFTISFFATFVLFPFGLYRHHMLELFNQLVLSSLKFDAGTSAKRREKIFITVQLAFVFSCVSLLVSVALAEVHFAWVVYPWPAFSALLAGGASFTLLMILLQSFSFLQFYGLIFLALCDLILATEKESISSKDIRNYQTIALLCNFLNTKFSYYVIPYIKYAFICCLIICATLAIQLYNWKTAGFVVIQLVVCFMVTYLIGTTKLIGDILSMPWYASCKWLWNLKCLFSMKNMEMLRICKSFRPLRIQIGGLYYMESHARLTLADFIIASIVDLLLIFK